MGGRGGSSGLSNVKSQKSSLIDISKMPDLTGSEKQVKWASDIREKAVQKINSALKFYEDRMKSNPKIETYEDEVSATREIRKTMEAVFSQTTSAAKIIENRGLFDERRISNEIENLVTQYRNKRRMR